MQGGPARARHAEICVNYSHFSVRILPPGQFVFRNFGHARNRHRKESDCKDLGAWPLRGFKTAAPLKRRCAFPIIFSLSTLRGFKTAAPLKRLNDWLTTLELMLSAVLKPRPH